MSEHPGFAGRLREWARSDPGRVAIREAGPTGWQEITFAGLDQLADRCASRLERAGARAGDFTLYFLRPSIEGYAVFYGLLRIGAVPVFIDPRMSLPRLLSCVAEAAPRILVGVPQVHALRLVARRAFAATEIALSSGRAWPGVLRLEEGLTESRADRGYQVDPASA
jgi:acyl-CoA synthetase (AMP-forming)/AMP-acid ligase II